MINENKPRSNILTVIKLENEKKSSSKKCVGGQIRSGQKRENKYSHTITQCCYTSRDDRDYFGILMTVIDKIYASVEQILSAKTLTVVLTALTVVINK